MWLKWCKIYTIEEDTQQRPAAGRPFALPNLLFGHGSAIGGGGVVFDGNGSDMGWKSPPGNIWGVAALAAMIWYWTNNSFHNGPVQKAATDHRQRSPMVEASYGAGGYFTNEEIGFDELNEHLQHPQLVVALICVSLLLVATILFWVYSLRRQAIEIKKQAQIGNMVMCIAAVVIPTMMFSKFQISEMKAQKVKKPKYWEWPGSEQDKDRLIRWFLLGVAFIWWKIRDTGGSGAMSQSNGHENSNTNVTPLDENRSLPRPASSKHQLHDYFSVNPFVSEHDLQNFLAQNNKRHHVTQGAFPQSELHTERVFISERPFEKNTRSSATPQERISNPHLTKKSKSKPILPPAHEERNSVGESPYCTSLSSTSDKKKNAPQVFPVQSDFVTIGPYKPRRHHKHQNHHHHHHHRQRQDIYPRHNQEPVLSHSSINDQPKIRQYHLRT